MKVPQSITVGGHSYRIVLNDELVDDNSCATVNHRKLRIEINPVRPPSQRTEAFIHELIHIIDRVYVNNELEERQIVGISEGLNQIISQLNIDLDWGDIKERNEEETITFSRVG